MQPSVPHDYDQIWRDVYGGMQDHGPTHKHLARLARKELAHLEYSSVYEVGCGAGHNFALLTEGRSVTSWGGMDISEVALEQARRRTGGQFTLGDIQTEPIEGQWDLVFCSLVLEHLERDEDALRNIAPAVGKYFVVSTIGGDLERYRSYEEQVGHIRNYAPGELDAKLERAGFRVLRSIAWGWPLYSPISRTLQRSTNAGIGKLSLAERVAAKIMYAAFFLNSHRRGDILLAVAEPAR
ncbi:MAG TPA: class I SAM-dependent methyltransferase [Pilimelia sp.]|nr:class I SAM-dependent methyltransferase [Pilimelia sp.]